MTSPYYTCKWDLPYPNLTFEIRFLTFQHIHGSRLRLLTFEILTLKLNLMFSTFSGMRPEREIFGNFKQLFLHFWAILGGIWAKFYLIHRVTLIWISFDFKRVAADETFGQFFSFDFNFVPVAPKRCFWGRKNSFMVLTSCCFEAFWSQTSNLDTS